MKDRFVKCNSCPAFHLLSDERKVVIERWEYKRQNNIARIKNVKLLLIGESMPADRYFYDINSDYRHGGLRYNLKEEFDQSEISDSDFLESFRRKGIILFDCALCPLHQLEKGNNTIKRKAATHCFLTQNIETVRKHPNIPIATIFPSKRGWKITEIPDDIRNRVNDKFGFNNLHGLKEIFLELKKN